MYIFKKYDFFKNTHNFSREYYVIVKLINCLQTSNKKKITCYRPNSK